jgi:hypothetical protein
MNRKATLAVENGPTADVNTKAECGRSGVGYQQLRPENCFDDEAPEEIRKADGRLLVEKSE